MRLPEVLLVLVGRPEPEGELRRADRIPEVSGASRHDPPEVVAIFWALRYLPAAASKSAWWH